jgi:hypothetical protein
MINMHIWVCRFEYICGRSTLLNLYVWHDLLAARLVYVATHQHTYQYLTDIFTMVSDLETPSA